MNEKVRNTLASVDEKQYNMDERTIAAICDILRRGNDAQVRRKGDGHVVLEVERTIKYSTL